LSSLKFVLKIEPRSSEYSSGVNFTNVLRTDYALIDPKSVKNTAKSSVSFYAFGIYKRKSCTYNVDEIEPRNLLITLLSSFFNVISYPFVNEVKYSTVVNATNAVSLMFHCCCWSVLSALRYLYIIHENWINETFEKPVYVSFIGITIIFIIFAFSLLTNFTAMISCGWPKRKMFEMSRGEAGLCLGIMLGSYLALISVSCGFYSLVLRQRGKIGNNKTHPETAASTIDGKDDDHSLESGSNMFKVLEQNVSQMKYLN